jgi:gliding motility-associated-like protein
VTIIPASTVALTPLSTVCNNGAINLSAPNGGSTYNWTGPNNFTSNVQNPVVNNAEVQNQGVYSVSITASGCVRTGSVNVDVYDVLRFTSEPSDTTLCFGQTANLGSSSAGGSGSYNYTWNPANDLTNPNANVTMVTANTTITYTLTLSDASCPVTQTKSTVVTVSVNPTPVITLGDDLRGCEPFLAPLESVSNPPSAACSWLFSNNTASNQCGTTTGFMFPLHGAYDATLSVVDVNGCTNTITATDYVTVDPNPVANFTYLPLNPTVLINEVTFNDQSTIGTPMKTLEWNFGDFYSLGNNTDSMANPSHVYDNPATYTVSLIVTNTFGCKDTTTRYVNVEEEFALFIPNAFTPTKSEGKNDMFIPQGIGFDPASFQMAIYDRWGTEIYKTNDITKGWDGSIKGGKSVQGVYVYKIVVTDFKKRDREFVGHITVL